MRLREMSIRTRISAGMLLVSTAVFLLVAGSSYQYSQQQLRESISAQQFSLISSLATQIDDKLNAAQMMMQHLAKDIPLGDPASAEKLQQTLERHRDLELFYDAGLLILSPDGRILAETPYNRERTGQDRSHRAYYQQATSTDKPFVSSPYKLSIQPNTPVIAISMPVKDASGKLRLVLAGRHSLGRDSFLSKIIDERIGKNGYLYLFDSQRALVIHPDRSRIMTVVPQGGNSVIDDALKGYQGTRENVNSKGVPGITSVRRLKNAPWYMAAHFPLVEAYQPLYRVRTYTMILSAAGLSALIVVVWMIMSRMTLPIRRLTKHIAQLQDKEGEARLLPVTSYDETGQLTRVFNEMIQELDDDAASREENDEIYRVISEFTIELAVWRMLDGSVRFISSNCLELTGYEDIEFYADPKLLDQIIHPEDKELWRWQHEKETAENAHAPFQVRIICKDGTVRWMHHTSHLTKNAKGEVTGKRGDFSDITTMVQAHEALQQEKLFIENLINSASRPMFVINREHRVIYWNRSLEIISGQAQDEMRGSDRHWEGFYSEKRQTLADLVIEKQEDLDSLYRQYSPSRYIKGGLQAEGWFELKGVRHYLLFEAAPILDEHGNIIAAIESFEDITERRLMEESVRRLTSAVEQTSNTIVITDTGGNIEFVNPQFVVSTGYTAEEVIGQNPRILKSGTTSPEEYARLWETISSGRVWHGELHNRKKDGTLYWESATISPLFDRQGNITGYLAVKEDITGQRASSEQIAEYRDQLEMKHIELEAAFKKVDMAKREWEETLDLLNDFIILADTDHKIRRYNKILANITGFGVNELVGRDWRKLLQEADFTFISFNGKVGELLHKPSSRSYDLNVYPVSTNRISTGFIVSLNDMTALKNTTNELQKTLAELNDAHSQIYQQEKMASIGQLAAGVAHEINNPMGFITSNLGSLEKYVNRLSEYIAVIDGVIQTSEGAQTNSIQEARKRLKIDRILDDAHQLISESQDGAGRVRRIVQDLKSFSRVDQAESAFIDLNESLETTINIAWNEIKYVAELKREFGDIPRIKCFPQQLNQVFLNLLVNAAHAVGNSGGEITVTTESKGDELLVKVRDNGCGMTEEVQRKIFEPFFTTKEVGKGTGLGLSISYDIVKKHGGEILVESEPGKGTTFTVQLPLNGDR